jgi:hypothetical protein
MSYGDLKWASIMEQALSQWGTLSDKQSQILKHIHKRYFGGSHA